MLPERASYLLQAGAARVIEFQGLEIPLLGLPDEKHVVVLGNRRAGALKTMRNFDQVPLYIAHNAEELDRWCTADATWMEGQPDVRPWTWSERGALLDHVMKVIGRPGGGGSGGSVVDVLAAYFGVHEVQLRNAAYLLRFERQGGAGGERASSLLMLADKGELLPQSAYRKLRDGDPVALSGRASSGGRGMTAKQQENALRNAVGVLNGVVMGLRQMGDISPDLAGDVRAEVTPPIQDARRALARIARQLQGLEEPVDESNKGESSG